MRFSRAPLGLAVLLAGCALRTTSPTPAATPLPEPEVYPDRTYDRGPAVVETPRYPRGDYGPRAARWQKVGEVRADGRRDVDMVVFPRGLRDVRRIMLRAENSGVRVHQVAIMFADGTAYSPRTEFRLRRGESQVIDLPGRQRTIERIIFRSSDARRGGPAYVEVWAR